MHTCGLHEPLSDLTVISSHRYANAVALLERYVPVTGSINGVFGAVAGAACMIGPNLVAILARRFGSPATDDTDAVYRCVLGSRVFPAVLLGGSHLLAIRARQCACCKMLKTAVR